jgi:hypothetical protein
MLFNTLTTSVVAVLALANGVICATIPPKTWTPVTYLGNQGAILCEYPIPFHHIHPCPYNTTSNHFKNTAGGTTTKANLVFTSGTVPSFNGTIVGGGIQNQTVRRFSFTSPHLSLSNQY